MAAAGGRHRERRSCPHSTSPGGTAVATGGLPKAATANRRELVDRTEKAELVETLRKVFKTTNVVVVAHYSGLTVAQMQTLRRQMKQAGWTRVKPGTGRQHLASRTITSSMPCTTIP